MPDSGETLKRHMLSTGAPLKRTHAKQSCTRCRKQKAKCSGEVPCERCVRCNEQDSCELWHRVAGRPKNADTLEKLEACAYYRPVLLKVAMDFAHRGKPAPDLVVQLARLWLLVAVHQKGADKEFAKAEIARRTLIPLAHFKEEADAVEAEHRFDALKSLPVGDATGKGAAPIKIGSAPAELLEWLAPSGRPIASAATAWVNQMFTSDARFSPSQSESDDAYSCQPLKWKFSIYETVTTIQGQSRYTELRNSTMRCIDECTDQAILSFNLPLPANEHAEWYASQTETLESFRKPSGQIVDENDFLQQYLQTFEEQVYRGTHELGAHWLDSRIPMIHRDRQGRLWNAIWEERCCLTDQGGFCHAARKIRLWTPRCSRARQVVSHFNELADSGQMIEQSAQQRHPAIPILGGMNIPAVSAELAGSGIVGMAQTTAVRAPDLSEELFDFDDLFESGSDENSLMPQRKNDESGRMTKRRATPSCEHPLRPPIPPHVLSAQHKHPLRPKPQGSKSHTLKGLPVGLPEDFSDVMDFFELDHLFEPQGAPQIHPALQSSNSNGVLSSFSKVAANERMRLCDPLGFHVVQSQAPHAPGLPLNSWCVDSACGSELIANDSDTYCYATDGTISGGCSATTASPVQQPSVFMTSIAVHDPTPDANGGYGIEVYSTASNFGTGNASGVELELELELAACHMKISPQSHSLYDRLVCERNVWYALFIIGQIHFWYNWYLNSMVQIQPHEHIQELWLGDGGALNSTLIYQPPHVPVPLIDVSWIRQHRVVAKLLLCCVCLVGSWYVKQIEAYLPHFYSAKDGEQQQSTQSESVSEAQRLKRLQRMSVLTMRTVALVLAMYEIVVQMLKFDQGNAFGKDVFNIVRAGLFATYLTVLSPSTIYWMYDLIRWVSIWTVFPVQIFVYLTFGGQYVTMCCTLNLAARACTLNIARIHIMGLLHEWSAAKLAQELLWVLAWFILPFDLELAPRLIGITAASCAAVCVKVWVARLYCDATMFDGDKQHKAPLKAPLTTLTA